MKPALSCFFLFGLLLVCGRTHAATQIAGNTLEQDLAAIALSGPLTELDLLVDGSSVFLPPAVSPALSALERARALFRFAGEQFQPWDAQVTVGQRLLTYGYGFGFCGEHARFLANTWSHAGLSARLVSLPKHVMVEVSVDGKWHLFDPQHRVDFSEVFARPMSFEDVLAANLPAGIDPMGYRWSHLAEIYRSGPANYTPLPGFIAPPTLSANPGQTVTIRPRESGEYYPLPIVYKRRPDYQTNLLNFYIVEIEHLFSAANPQARFSKMLPILEASSGEAEIAQVLVDGVQRPTQELEPFLKGKAAEVVVTMPPGARFRMRYALAGWIGDRLFRAEPGAVLTVIARQEPKPATLRYGEQPQLSISPIRIIKNGVSPGCHRVQLDLIWSELNQEPQDYEVVVDELETGMLMEYLGHVGKFQFHWDPHRHGRNGKLALSFPWTPKAEKTERVPYENRVLLAQLIGPGLLTGRHFKTASFQTETKKSVP